MNVVLREATPADLDAVVEVFLACWRGSYAAVLPQSLVASISDERAVEMWTRALGSARGHTVVADDGERILGLTRWEVSGAAGQVHSLYVSPAAQGSGLGTRLLDHAEDAFVQQRVTSATLWVFAANGPSVGFYRSRGWRPDGATRVEPEFGQPELRLRKDLREGEPG